MKIRKLIETLEKMKKEHGEDVLVYIDQDVGDKVVKVRQVSWNEEKDNYCPRGVILT